MTPTSTLSPVANSTKPTTPSARIHALQAQARIAASEHVHELLASLLVTERLASEVHGGGAAYPVGIREAARQLRDQCEAKRLTIERIGQ